MCSCCVASLCERHMPESTKLRAVLSVRQRMSQPTLMNAATTDSGLHFAVSCAIRLRSPLTLLSITHHRMGDGGRPGSPKLVVRTSGHKLRNSFHGSGRGPDCLLVFSSLAVLLRTSCTVFLIAIGRVSEQSQVCSSGNLCTMHALRCDVFRKGTRILHSIVINTLFFADTISTHSYRCL